MQKINCGRLILLHSTCHRCSAPFPPCTASNGQFQQLALSLDGFEGEEVVLLLLVERVSAYFHLSAAS